MSNDVPNAGALLLSPSGPGGPPAGGANTTGGPRATGRLMTVDLRAAEGSPGGAPNCRNTIVIEFPVEWQLFDARADGPGFDQ